ncbi:unnamed protein product, partial [Effrenium voratum]
MICHSWGIFCVVVAQDPVATELQQLLDTLREAYTARGAGWLCEELAKQTAAQLRQLAGTTGVQQREAGRKMSKAELLETHFRGAGAMRERRRVAQLDPAATESQQLLGSMREGFAARGAGWLREGLAKQTAAQLRQLAGAAGVQQYEAGRNTSKAELLEKVAQHVSEEQDPAATESQQLLDSMREGFAARGAAWLRGELAKQTAVQLRELAGTARVQQREAGCKMSKAELLEKAAQHVSEEQELAKQTAVQLRQLAGTAGVQQREAGRKMSKAELLEKVAQHVSKEQELAKQTAAQLRQLAGTAGVQQREAGRKMSKAELLEKVAQHISEKQDTVGHASADDPVTADGLRQLAAALGDRDFVEFHCAMLSRVYKDWLRIVMVLCPLAAPGAQADIKYHVWRLLRKLCDARAETAEAVAAAAPDIVESSNLRRAAAAYCLDVTVEVIARRHCSAAEEARILATGVVSALQQWPAVEAALASQVAVTREDAVASLQGWWRLADCQERADPVDVASRLCFLAKLDEEPPAADTDDYEDRKDVLEARLPWLG